MVLPYINMNPPWVNMSSQSWSPLPPPCPYHLSGSSQCTSPKHPVSCIKPKLVICFIYDIIHVSVPFSRIILPSPSPTESKRLFYTSVSLLLSHVQGYRYHLSKFHIYVLVYCIGTSLVAQTVKRLPIMRETWVQALGQEDLLGKEMATHSSILAWRIPWTEELGGLQSTCHKESDMTERLHFHFHFLILYWCFSFWLTSLCIISSSFIHLIITDSNVFFWMAE